MTFSRRFLPAVLALSACGGRPAGAQVPTPAGGGDLTHAYLYEVAPEQVTPQQEEGFVEVSGTAVVMVAPDRARASFAVESQGAGNYKSTLQQYAQRELSSTPVYRLVRESGPDHRKSFLIAAVIADRQFAAAWGSNKKDAEQRAASNALAELHDQAIPFPSDVSQ